MNDIQEYKDELRKVNRRKAYRVNIEDVKEYCDSHTEITGGIVFENYDNLIVCEMPKIQTHRYNWYTKGDIEDDLLLLISGRVQSEEQYVDNNGDHNEC